MKKVFVGLMVMVMVLTVMTNVIAEMLVKGHGGFTVQEWLEEWIYSCGDTSYLKCEVYEDDCYYGYGVFDYDGFYQLYGKNFSIETIEETLGTVYKGLEMEVKTVGFYEGYDVYWMHVRADEPIGYKYSVDDTYEEYYEGCMYFMVFSMED